MKKILYLLVFATLLQSCKKNTGELPADDDSTKKYAVNFNVSGFTQTVVPTGTSSINKQATAVSNLLGIYPGETAITKLMYLVYDNQGKQVSRLEQTTGEANKLFRIAGGKRFVINSAAPFGSLADSLKTGTYTLIVAAGGERSNLQQSQQWNTPDTYPEPGLNEAAFFPTLSAYDYSEDAFVYKGTLEVSGVANATKPIVLKRIVGQFTLNMEDGIPAGTYYVKTRIAKNNTTYQLNTLTGVGAINSTNTGIISVSPVTGVADTKITWYILNTSTPVDLTIEFAGADLRTLFTKTITGIPVKVNQRTIVTGKLNPTYPSNFFVDVNQQWAGSSTIKF